MIDWLFISDNPLISYLILGLFISLGISSLGFFRVVYFISIGYALSIVAMSAIMPWQFIKNMGWLNFLQNLILLLWGLRLGFYLLAREFRSAFAKELQATHQRTAGMKASRKFTIWAAVSALYVCMYSPAAIALIHANQHSQWSHYIIWTIGLLIMATGLLIETLADRQKSDFKSTYPQDYCNIGLYRWVRCPNYLGEIMIWLGNWIVASTFITGGLEWVISLVGLVCITLIMMGSTKRLEQTQSERYGHRQDFRAYTSSVPVLFPWIPVYSLKNLKVYLE